MRVRTEVNVPRLIDCRAMTPNQISWNVDPQPFAWVATADEILAKVKVVEANVRKLIDNNAK
jgi:hypothetical protein